MSTAIIVDDHPFIRASLKMALEQDKYEVVAESGDGVEAIQMARQHNPDLILLDISIPKLDGLEVIARIREMGFSSKILILTSQAPEFYSARCMKAGANGFISKTDGLVELQRAVRAVMSGFIYFPILPGQSLMHGEMNTTDQELIDSLSNRELSILQQLARGHSNKEIGEIMLLSNKTVSTYRMRLTEKLKLKSIVNLAEFAKRNNLV